MDLERAVSDTIAKLRDRTGQTNTTLAQALGKSRAAIGQRFNDDARGHWTVNDLGVVARHFGVTPCDLINGYDKIPAYRMPKAASDKTPEKAT